jgi:hypothetical protein
VPPANATVPVAPSGAVPPTKAQVRVPVAVVENSRPADLPIIPQVMTKYTFDVYNLKSPQVALYTLSFNERNPENVKSRARMLLMANSSDMAELGLRLKLLEVLE